MRRSRSQLTECEALSYWPMIVSLKVEHFRRLQILAFRFAAIKSTGNWQKFDSFFSLKLSNLLLCLGKIFFFDFCYLFLVFTVCDLEIQSMPTLLYSQRRNWRAPSSHRKFWNHKILSKWIETVEISGSLKLVSLALIRLHRSERLDIECWGNFFTSILILEFLYLFNLNGFFCRHHTDNNRTPGVYGHVPPPQSLQQQQHRGEFFGFKFYIIFKVVWAYFLV